MTTATTFSRQNDAGLRILRSVFTWGHGGHIGVPKQWNGSHVGAPNKSCRGWTFLLDKRLFCIDTSLVSENAVQTQVLYEPSYSLSYVYFSTKDLIIG